MALETWKLLAGITVVLAIMTIVSMAGITSSRELLGMLVILVFVAPLTYIGYRLGRRISTERTE